MERLGVTRESMSALVHAADALYGSRDPRALGVLLAVYGRAQGDWGRVRLLRSLASVEHREEVRPTLLAAARDPVWRLRMLTARALAQDSCAEGVLLALTRDPQWRVREATCRALGSRPTTEAALAALEAAQNDPDARVIAAAERAGNRLRARTSLEIW